MIRVLSFIIVLWSLAFPRALAQGLPLFVNELGRIPILEYHQVNGEKEERWSRHEDAFKADLLWLYNNGYRAISMRDFMRGWIDVPKGMKPVVLTFDDGGGSQFIIRKDPSVLRLTSPAPQGGAPSPWQERDLFVLKSPLEGGELYSVNPHSAVGIMDEFLKEHADFGSAAIFYINAKPFAESESSKMAVEYLLETGREIGQHTWSHANLSQIGSGEVERQLSTLEQYVWDELGISKDHSGLVLDSIAYPFGGVPTEGGMDVLRRHVKNGLLVGADPAWPAYHVKYSPYYVPRIQAIDEEWKRWFRRNSGETQVSSLESIFRPYVSDGDPRTISVSDETERKLVLEGSLEEGVEVRMGSLQFTVDSLQQGAVEAVVELKDKEEDEGMRISYAYKACGNEDAEEWIGYKAGGLMSRLNMAMGEGWWMRFLSPRFETGFDWEVFRKVGSRWMLAEEYDDKKVGIYLNSASVPSGNGEFYLRRLHEIGGNMVVFDLPKSRLRELDEAEMDEYANYVEKLHRDGIYAVTRLVVAQDTQEVTANPQLGIQHKDGGVWRDNKNVFWLDLSKKGAKHNILELVKKIERMGVDEVQLDYIRFPTDGDTGSARYGFDDRERWEVIADFLRMVRVELAKTGTYLSVDFLGIVGWNKGYDGWGTGQRIQCLAPYVDAIYSMSYPSHFGPGFAGHKNPADEPYYFVKQTQEYFLGFAEGTHTDIRTWVQAFAYRVSGIPYDEEYIREQAQAVWDGGGDGYVLWNAGNNYEMEFGGMVGRLNSDASDRISDPSVAAKASTSPLGRGEPFLELEARVVE